MIDLAAVGARVGAPVVVVGRAVGGASKRTLRVTVGGARAYLAVAPAGEVPAGAHDLRREHRFLRALGRSVGGAPGPEPAPVPELPPVPVLELPPVPRVLDYCEDPAVAGAPYLLTAEAPGARVTGAGIEVGDPAALAYGALDVLAALHAVDPAAAGIAAPPGRYLERQVVRWSGQLAQTATAGRLGDLAPLAAWLLDHLPPEEERSLVHGDYGFHNLLVDPARSRVTAVLDWELATVGDPLADLVFFVKSWGAGALSANPAQDAVSLLAGAPDRAALETRYERLTGRRVGPHRTFYDVFCLWRSIGIQEGVHARSGGRLLAGEVPRMVATARRLAGLGAG